MIVIGIHLSFFFFHGPGGNVCLHSDQWLDACLFAGVIEFDGAVHRPVVCNGKRLKTLLFGVINEALDLRESVEQGIVGMDMEVGELQGFLLFWSFYYCKNFITFPIKFFFPDFSGFSLESGIIGMELKQKPMSLFESERQEELFLLIGDHFRAMNRKLMTIFLVVLALAVPSYFIAKMIFAKTIASAYRPPVVLPLQAARTPVEVLEKKIVRINSNTYSGFVKLANANLNWGVPDQGYKVRVLSKAGTVLSEFSAKTYILPASQKVVALPRFSADMEPHELEFTLETSKFIGKRDLPEIKLEVQRTQLKVENGALIVSAVVINRSPFKVSKIDLPVILYDVKNGAVAANFTNVNEVLSGETRSFQYFWPNKIDGAVRAEIRPEVNYFLPNIIQTESGRSQFD